MRHRRLKDQHDREKQGECWEEAKLGGQLHKAFMAEIGEEMIQAEVAHHAQRIPEFFVSRRVKRVHLYRKTLALTTRRKPRQAEEHDGGEEWGWEESGGTRMHAASDIELYERRTRYWFWSGDETVPIFAMEGDTCGTGPVDESL